MNQKDNNASELFATNRAKQKYLTSPEIQPRAVEVGRLNSRKIAKQIAFRKRNAIK